MTFLEPRLRRLRRTPKFRDLIRETVLTPNDLTYPLFVKDGISKPEPIIAMPGQFRLTLSGAIKDAKKLTSLGIPAVLLFGIPAKKDETGSAAYDKDGIIQRTIKALKQQMQNELVVMTDVCLCQYTNHGHCGIIKNDQILNDSTIEILQRVALSHAEAGADVVAPSGMLDGQVQSIRKALDQAGFTNVAIMAYSAKHASHLYGPFRTAAYCAPSGGDRKSHQLDYANPNEALREVALDVKEGTDMVMVKPALAYLDLIYRIKTKFGLPTAAYNVSGEYSMIKAAAEKGWIEEKGVILELLTGIKRAGADIIVTYFAKDVASWLNQF